MFVPVDSTAIATIPVTTTVIVLIVAVTVFNKESCSTFSWTSGFLCCLRVAGRATDAFEF